MSEDRPIYSNSARKASHGATMRFLGPKYWRGSLKHYSASVDKEEADGLLCFLCLPTTHSYTPTHSYTRQLSSCLPARQDYAIIRESEGTCEECRRGYACNLTTLLCFLCSVELHYLVDVLNFAKVLSTNEKTSTT